MIRLRGNKKAGQARKCPGLTKNPVKTRNLSGYCLGSKGACLEQPASRGRQVSFSNTLEPINFSALNRFRLKAG
jgi:hypothetical protein